MQPLTLSYPSPLSCCTSPTTGTKSEYSICQAMTKDMLHRKKRNSGQKSDVEVQLTTGLANQLLRHIVYTCMYLIFIFHPTTIINVHVHTCTCILLSVIY